MDNQMIGRRGEKRFDLLCSDANVTCNGSKEDDFGWDKLIEFHPKKLPYVALDMQPGRKVACVQVKTTTGTGRSVAIKLSNALHYAHADIPQFIVLVVLDGCRERYYARHVWTPLIAAWLKAGREADAKGITATNLEAVTLSFSDDDECSSDSLLRWIESEIDSIKLPYATSKNLIINTVGFESGRGSAHISFDLEDNNHLLDIQLGLKPWVRAKRFTYTSQRFGINAGKPEVDERDILMRITPEGRQCKLRLEFPAGVNVTLPATSFAANDGQSSAVRVKAAALDVIYGPKGRVRANAKLNQDDKLRIEDLRAFSHLMSMENSRSVGVQIQISDRTLDLGAIKMNKAGKDSSWTRMADYMDALWAIEQVAGVDAPELAVSDFNSTGLTLELLSALCGERHIRIDFTPDPSVDPKCDGLLAFSTAQVGSHIYSAVVRRPVKLDRMNAGRRQIAFGQSQLLCKREIPGTCSVECRGVKDVSTKEEVDTWRWHRWAPLGSRL